MIGCAAIFLLLAVPTLGPDPAPAVSVPRHLPPVFNVFTCYPTVRELSDGLKELIEQAGQVKWEEIARVIQSKLETGQIPWSVQGEGRWRVKDALEAVTRPCRRDLSRLFGMMEQTDISRYVPDLGRAFEGDTKDLWLDLRECAKLNHSSRYCAIKISPFSPGEFKYAEDGLADITIGACLPRGCRPYDLHLLARATLALLEPPSNWERQPLKLATCQEELAWPGWRQLHPSQKLFVMIVALLVGLFVISNLVDISPAGKTFLMSTEDSSSYKKSDLQPDKGNRGSKRSLLLLLCQMVSAFSLRQNVRSLWRVNMATSYLHGLDVVRLLLTGCILLIHSLLHFVRKSDNPVDIFETSLTGIVIPGIFIMDAFLFLSAVLTSYLTLKQMSKLPAKIPTSFWCKYMLHRYVRLTPLVMFVSAYEATIHPHLLNGVGAIHKLHPSTIDWMRDSCVPRIPLGLFHVFNMIPSCTLTLWFTSIDFQLYILAIVVLARFHKSPADGYRACTCAIVLGSVYTTVFSRYYGIGFMYQGTVSSDQDGTGLFGIIGLPIPGDAAHTANPEMWTHIMPHFRFQSYFSGLAIGAFLHYNHGEQGVLKAVLHRLVKWLPLQTLVLSSVYWLGIEQIRTLDYFWGRSYEMKLTPDVLDAHWLTSGLFDTYWHLTSRLTVAWICASAVIACNSALLLSNPKGAGYKLLTSKWWARLGRLTFGVYLVHQPILEYRAMSGYIFYHLTTFNIVTETIVVFIASTLVSLLLSLLVEQPVQKIFSATVTRK